MLPSAPTYFLPACLAAAALATCCGNAAFLSPWPLSPGRRPHVSAYLNRPPHSLLHDRQAPRRRPLALAGSAGAGGESDEGVSRRQARHGKMPKSVLSNAARNEGRGGRASDDVLPRPSATLQPRGPDADATDARPAGKDQSEADYEISKPGHGSGKSVLALAATLAHVPISPACDDETGSAAGAAGGARFNKQVVVCSGGHDDEIHVWRLQARPRLVVGDELCAQAPELKQVGTWKLPAAVSSVFSLVPTPPATDVAAGHRELGELLVGEGRTRQVSRWLLRLAGAMPSGLPQKLGSSAAPPGLPVGRTPESSTAAQTSSQATSWGWQIDLASAPRDVDDQAGEEDEDGEDENRDAQLQHGGTYAHDADAGRVDQDGSILMRVQPSEADQAVDTGGWNVEATPLGTLPALHTGWVRGVSCAGNQSLVAYSIGCNFIKVWRLRTGTEGGTEDGDGRGAAAGQGAAGRHEELLPKWLGDLETNADILCLAAGGGLVASGSVDGWLRVWNVADRLTGNTQQLLAAATPASLQAHEGRISALVMPDTAEGDEGGEEAGCTRVVFTCAHDGFVRRWSYYGAPDALLPAHAPRLQLEGELDVLAAMGLHADDDERLLCMAASPPETCVPIPGNWASASGRSSSSTTLAHGPLVKAPAGARPCVAAGSGSGECRAPPLTPPHARESILPSSVCKDWQRARPALASIMSRCLHLCEPRKYVAHSQVGSMSPTR